MKQIVSTEYAPKAIGPYVQAVASGNLIFTSGQLGINRETGKLEEGIEMQTHRAMKNLAAILKEKNLSFENIIKTTIFLDDLDDFKIVNTIYGSYFKGDYPARSCFEVSKLPLGGLIEIECIAAVNSFNQ